MMRQYKITVNGQVQGVFFRHQVKEWAKKHKVCGSVKNEEEGGVTIVAQMEAETLEELIQWCRFDAPGTVEDVKVVEEPLQKSFSSFRILV